MRKKIQNKAADYCSRAVIGGADTDAIAKPMIEKSERENFNLDQAGYFLWNAFKKRNPKK